MLSAARLHTKWGPRAPGAAHLGPGRPGGLPVGPRYPSPPDPTRLPRTLFSAMGSLSCSADITDRRAWLAPGPREAGVFDAVAPPPPGPPPGPPGPLADPRGPPGRALSPGRPGRGPTLKSLGGGQGLGAPHTLGVQPGSGPRPGGGARARARPAEYARPGPRCVALRPRAGETRPPRTQKPPVCSGRSGGRGAAPRPPRPACAPQPSTGPGFGGGDPGRAEPRTRTELRGRGLAGRLRCAPGRARQALRSPRTPMRRGPRALQGPVPPALRFQYAPRSLGFTLSAALQGPRLPGSSHPVRGTRAPRPALRSPPPSKAPNPPILRPAPLHPGLLSALQAPRFPSSTPLCTPSPAPASTRKTAAPNFIPAPAGILASQLDFRKTFSKKAA